MLAAICGGDVPTARDALEVSRAIDPLAAELLEPLLGTTVSPTMISASTRGNVIPSVCEVTVDSRVLPGGDPDAVLRAVQAYLGEGDYELEPLERRGGTRSPLRRPLWDAIAAFVRDEAPGAAPVPICTSGFTDSHWVREAFGAVAYGFFPARFDPETAARLLHSADERVPVEDVELGVRFLQHVARAICG